MQVDHVLILAAGKGTRMGNIGESLPKVIWPIFNKSILELEVEYAKTFNPKNIYINLYNYKDKVKEHIQEMANANDVTVLEEAEELDIGGAIHNMANVVNYTGTLLVINSDQFLFLDDDIRLELETEIIKSDSVLLSYTVDKSLGYNALDLVGDKVVGIIKNEEVVTESMETYTGMSLIKLETLINQKGKSRFFDSVANLNKNHVTKVNIGSTAYWDFGTLKRYYNSMFEICKQVSEDRCDKFLNFLKKCSAFDSAYVKPNSYNSDVDDVINLGDIKNGRSNTIYLSNTSVKASVEKSICRDDKEDII
jgi:mannose-1-phosphate guanylyltransferase